MAKDWEEILGDWIAAAKAAKELGGKRVVHADAVGRAVAPRPRTSGRGCDVSADLRAGWVPALCVPGSNRTDLRLSRLASVSAAHLRRAHYLAGYPERDALLVEDAPSDVNALPDSTGGNVLLRSALDASVADPQWRAEAVRAFARVQGNGR